MVTHGAASPAGLSPGNTTSLSTAVWQPGLAGHHCSVDASVETPVNPVVPSAESVLRGRAGLA